jgi:uncharacterized protein DUF5907
MKFESLILPPGLRAAQPSAASVPKGTLYFVTDEGVVERSNGTAWEAFSGSGTIPNDAVTYAKMQNVSAASRLLGRGSAGGAGDPEEIALGAGLAIVGTTLAATGGAGTVDTSGTPAAGNLAKFADADTITNANLTGDVTTSGGVAATIAADAVTYAKMQNVSAASKLLGRGDSGSGDPEEITLGSGLAMAGTTLSATGGGGGGGGGALVLLASLAASASATLDLTTRNATGQTGALFQSDYDEYIVEFVSVLPATNNVTLQGRVSTDGGASWDSSAVYARTFQYGAANNTTSGGGATGATLWDITGSQTSTATGAASGRLRFYNPLSTAVHKSAIGDFGWLHTTVDWIGYHTAFAWKSTAAINALRFFMSSGNIASGTVRVYGVAKSSPGGGGLVLVEQHVASGSASLDFTTGITSAFDEYLIEFVDVAPATNNVDLLMLLSTNGGSSYDSGANYARQTRLDQSTFNTVAGGNSGLNSLVAITNVSNGSTFGLNLSGKLWAPGSAAHYKTFTFQGVYRNNDGSFYSVVGSGIYISATAVNAFQVKFSSGNVASGTVRLYGVAKT